MYYFEILSTLLFFIFIGAVFSPVLGGCFIILLMLLILSGVIVFFSINFVWFLAAGLIIYAFNFGVKFWRWYKLPDVNEYLSAHPGCKLSVGVACYNCGSDKLLNQGLLHNKSRWRFYVC